VERVREAAQQHDGVASCPPSPPRGQAPSHGWWLKAMYDLLLGPALAEAPRGARVVVVPHRELCFIPFSALLVRAALWTPR
jgi:hypothetical protein